MQYKLIYHPDVLKEDLRDIPANIKSRISKAIETRLLRDPVMFGQPLRQSLKGYRKLRVGDWRVIYRVEHSSIIILIIGNRKDVYQEVFRRIF
ncbi:MAG: type II toxin-antitoxin system RelE/ParE family toxin [Candidatus Omnitrophota bacterium]|nr:type II toxin-antitoxin system RelE/ParE family toxin [Candidatus Omnitrophota bacterium]